MSAIVFINSSRFQNTRPALANRIAYRRIPVWEQQIADYAYSNQKCGTCQQKSGIHQVFLNTFCHQNPFAHHIVSNRIQNIACQRRVTGCNITENMDKNKVQHYVGYRCFSYFAIALS